MSPYPSSSEFRQALRLERLRAWVMSFICGALFVVALTAATRLPLYLAAGDYVRLGGVFLFLLLAVTGLTANIRHHLCLHRLVAEQDLRH